MFKNRNFLKLWISQMLSQVTINLMNFYVLTQIFLHTKSTIAVALMWIAGALPALLFGPFSGPLVDSISRRKAMVITNLLQAVTVAMLLFSPSVYYLYIIVFFYWLFDQIYLPSQQATIPQVVSANDLTKANGIFLLTQQGSVLLGFGLGGILLGILGRHTTIALAALGLVVAAISVYFLPKDKPQVDLSQKDFTRFWKDLLAGYSYVRSHREIFLPVLMVICTQVFISVISITLPTFTHEVLHLNLNFSGLLLIVPGAIGALLVTRSLPAYLKTARKKTVVQTGLLIGAITLILLSLVSSPWLASVIAIGIGMAIAAVTVPSQTLIQERTPNWLRGRVYSQLSFMLIIASTLPILIAGTLADILGVSVFMGILGVLLLFVYLFVSKKGDYVLANGFGL